jgi:MFS family permease
LPEVHDPYIALRFPNYRRYFTGNACALIGTQMTTYTVAYELYRRSESALVLGMVGLVQVIPIILLALPAGHMVDRFNRKTLVLMANAVQILLWVVMGFSSRFATHWLSGGVAAPATAPTPPAVAATQGFLADPHVPILLSLLFINGMCRAIVQPAKQSLLPMLVPSKHFANAVTWNSSLFEISNVLGPMAGGFAVAAMLVGSWSNPHDTWAYAVIYWLNAFLQLVQWTNIARIHLEHKPRPREPVTLESMLAGVKFVYHRKVILGAITLDMFAVLLGGATALLPVFAEEVLHVGPVGLAWLRSAPSMGALTTAMILAHMPPMERAGRNLLWAVAGFGGSIILFGVSTNFWLSMAALMLTGVFDNISVVVRHTLVQLMTPDEMRGRVNAVNSVFISSSNELGEFESGTTAHLGQLVWGPMIGPMVAVAAGGMGTIVVVICAALAWPELRRVGRLSHVKEEPVFARGFPVVVDGDQKPTT